MQEPPPIEILIAQLAQFAEDFGNALKAPDINWTKSPPGGGWSLTEVACHLRDVEREVHQSRIRAILGERDAFLPGVVADAWAEERRYRGQNGPEALGSFLSARLETLQLLSAIDERMWERRAQHAFFGSTSLQELVYLIAQHDAAHWEQTVALLGG
jgi:hypothetical protein